MKLKLYEVKAGTKVRLPSDVRIPPDAPVALEGDIFTVGKLDGMYVNGTLNGQRAYIAAWTEVEVIE